MSKSSLQISSNAHIESLMGAWGRCWLIHSRSSRIYSVDATRDLFNRFAAHVSTFGCSDEARRIFRIALRRCLARNRRALKGGLYQERLARNVLLDRGVLRLKA